MNDLTGLGKLADSKLANKIYDDFFSGAMQKGGIALETAVDLFVTPIQLLGSGKQRIISI